MLLRQRRLVTTLRFTFYAAAGHFRFAISMPLTIRHDDAAVADSAADKVAMRWRRAIMLCEIF